MKAISLTREKVIVVLMLAFALASGILIGASRIGYWTLVFSVLVVVLAFINAYVTVAFVFFFSLVYYEPVLLYFPTLEPTRYIMEVLIFALFVKTIVEAILNGRMRFTPLFLPAIAWVTLGVFSAWLNGVSILDFSLKFRQMFRFVLLFLVIVNLRFNRKQIRNMVLWVVGLLLVNIPVCIYQFFLVGKRLSDLVQGLTPGQGELTYAVIWLLSFLWGLYLYCKKPGFILTFLLMGVLAVLPVLNGVRSVIILYPVLGVILLLAPGLLDLLSRKNPLPRTRDSLFVGLKLLAVGFACFFSSPFLRKIYDELYRTFVWGMHFQNRSYSAFHVGRLIAPKIAHTYLAVKGLPALIAGYGLGSIIMSPFTKRAVSQTTFSAITSQLPLSLYEMGYLGFALYGIMALGVGWFIVPTFRRCRDGFERAFVLSSVVLLACFFGLTMYHWVWIERVSGTLFWGLGGLLAALYYALKDEESAENSEVPA